MTGYASQVAIGLPESRVAGIGAARSETARIVPTERSSVCSNVVVRALTSLLDRLQVITYLGGAAAGGVLLGPRKRFMTLTATNIAKATTTKSTSVLINIP